MQELGIKIDKSEKGNNMIKETTKQQNSADMNQDHQGVVGSLVDSEP